MRSVIWGTRLPALTLKTEDGAVMMIFDGSETTEPSALPCTIIGDEMEMFAIGWLLLMGEDGGDISRHRELQVAAASELRQRKLELHVCVCNFDKVS